MTRIGALLVALGLVVAVAAGLLAPPQPELFQSGGACNIAPCGTLEDPPRWQAMWWLLGVGAVVAASGAAFVVAGLPVGDGSWPAAWRWLVGLLLGAVLWVLVLVAAPVAGLVGSAQLAVAVLLGGGFLVSGVVALLLTHGAATRRTALAALALSAPVPLAVAAYLVPRLP